MSVESKPQGGQEVPVSLDFEPEPPFAASDYVPPPPVPAAAKSSNAAMWIVLGILAVAGGGMLLSVLACGLLGMIFYLSSSPAPAGVDLSMPPPYAETYDPATYDLAPSYDASYPSAAQDAWSDPDYVAPEAFGDESAAYEPSTVEPEYVDDVFGDADDAYDPDWQLELPQYQQDAIRDLNQQREMFGP